MKEYLYLVTGTLHGSVVIAKTEGEARRAFHAAWDGESIIDVSKTNNIP